MGETWDVGRGRRRRFCLLSLLLHAKLVIKKSICRGRFWDYAPHSYCTDIGDTRFFRDNEDRQEDAVEEDSGGFEDKEAAFSTQNQWQEASSLILELLKMFFARSLLCCVRTQA